MGRSHRSWTRAGLLPVLLFVALVLVMPPVPAAPSSVTSTFVQPASLREDLAAPVAENAPESLDGFSLVGPAPPSLTVTGSLTLAVRDASGLDAASEEGTAHLTSAQVQSDFGPSPSEVQELRSYLATQGLRAEAPPNAEVWLLTGTVASFDTAFDTSLSSYAAPGGGTSVLAFTRAPSSPAGLPIAAIAPPDGADPMRPTLSSSGPLPSVTENTGTVCPSGALDPADVQGAYNITPVHIGGDLGQGETLGIVDAYDSAEPQTRIASDLSAFSTCFDLPAENITFDYPVPGGNLNNTSSTGWGVEIALDTQWAHATAPDAGIQMVLSPNSGYGLYFGADYLIAQDKVTSISLSWGEPESGIENLGPCSLQCNASTDGSMATLGPVLADAAAEGINVFAASGDCGANGGTPEFTPWYPASDPHAIGTGATILNTTDSDVWAGETAWSGSETFCLNGGGSGGGFALFPRPSWQAGPGFSEYSNSTRGVPDVALVGGTPLEILYNGQSTYVEGTSAAAPQWSGMSALIAEARGTSSLGFLAPSLYSVLQSPGYRTDFHPIPHGNNGFTATSAWDPITGMGTPQFSSLVDALSGMPIGQGPVPGAALLTAEPAAGVVPLPVHFNVTASAAVPAGSIVQYLYGDTGPPYQQANASTSTSLQDNYTYTRPGAFTAFAVAYGPNDNVSMTNAVVINVGNAGPIGVSVSATPAPGTAGVPVSFSATASGGTAPYRYAYYWGDGTSESSWGDDGPSLSHTYTHDGAYTVTVIANDSSSPMRGGEATLCIDVGPSGPCGTTVPTTLVPRVVPSQGTLLANGSESFTAQVTDNGLPEAGAMVYFSTPIGTISPRVATANASGMVEATYTAPDLGQTAQFGLYANATAPGVGRGVGEALIVVNPVTGPSIIPWLRRDQVTVPSGASDGLVLGVLTAVTNLTVPGASVTLSTTLGHLVRTSGTLDTGAQFADTLIANNESTPTTGWISITAQMATFTTYTSRWPFTVVPNPGQIGLVVNVTTVPSTVASLGSTQLTIRLHNALGVPEDAAAPISISADPGGFVTGMTREATGVYTAWFSTTYSQTNLTTALLVNATGPIGTTNGSTALLVDVLWGHGPLNVQMLSDPPVLAPRATGVVTLVITSVDYGIPLANVFVALDLEVTTSEGGSVSPEAAWTNPLGEMTTNLTAPDVPGNVTLNVVAIPFVYIEADVNMTVPVQTFYNRTGNHYAPTPNDTPLLIGATGCVLILSFAVVGVMISLRRRRSSERPGAHDAAFVPETKTVPEASKPAVEPSPSPKIASPSETVTPERAPPSEAPSVSATDPPKA